MPTSSSRNVSMCADSGWCERKSMMRHGSCWLLLGLGLNACTMSGNFMPSRMKKTGITVGEGGGGRGGNQSSEGEIRGGDHKRTKLPHQQAPSFHTPTLSPTPVPSIFNNNNNKPPVIPHPPRQEHLCTPSSPATTITTLSHLDCEATRVAQSLRAAALVHNGGEAHNHRRLHARRAQKVGARERAHIVRHLRAATAAAAAATATASATATPEVTAPAAVRGSTAQQQRQAAQQVTTAPAGRSVESANT
eukprot:3564-Chlamydomonas_euryale.AAC.2